MANVESLEGKLEDKANEFRSGTERTKRQIRDSGDAIKSQAEEAWSDLIDSVKRHPGKALGVAAAAGFAIGSLATAASRRRSFSARDQVRNLAGTGADAWDRVRSQASEDARSAPSKKTPWRMPSRSLNKTARH